MTRRYRKRNSFSKNDDPMIFTTKYGIHIFRTEPKKVFIGNLSFTRYDIIFIAVQTANTTKNSTSKRLFLYTNIAKSSRKTPITKKSDATKNADPSKKSRKINSKNTSSLVSLVLAF
jgi:UDP-galactopyranose mutase